MVNNSDKSHEPEKLLTNRAEIVEILGDVCEAFEKTREQEVSKHIEKAMIKLRKILTGEVDEQQPRNEPSQK